MGIHRTQYACIPTGQRPALSHAAPYPKGWETLGTLTIRLGATSKAYRLTCYRQG